MFVIIRFFGLLLVWNTWLKFRRKRYEKEATDKRKINKRDVFVYIEKGFFFFSHTKTYIGVPLKRSSQFKIHPETDSDRLFKSWGMSTELECGDLDFDRKVYLETDATALVKELSDNIRSRELILEIFKEKGLLITANTDWLEVKLDGERRDTDHIQSCLAELADWLDSVPSKKYSLFTDPLYYKALTAEFIFTGIAFFGLFSFAANIFTNHMIDTGILMSKAVKLTLIACLVLIPFNFWFLKGSSRSHRLILENFIYIIIGVPLACFFIVRDVNEAWDKSEPQSYELPVVMKRVRRLRNFTQPSTSMWRRYFHTMEMDMSPLGINQRKTIRVSREAYLNGASSVEVEIGQGYYNQRYIKKINYLE